MRKTIRFNKEEELKLQQLKEYVHEEDISKLVKFAIDTAIHHLNFVTEALVGPEWDVAFMKKRKTRELKRRVF